ncbi:MAG: metallophosphoesterase, partial [Candidatus Latescibacteria bacterium]|nr:metallophosphoesterase [Candidatus Latescibacterota bacterium]
KDRKTTESFAKQIQLAQQKNVDLLALTGDQVNYPSPTSIAFVAEEVKKSGLPHIYTAGNHDWHYEGMEGSSDQLRETWQEKLSPLYEGHNPSHTAIELNGLCFVTIDNATYQVNETQLAFYREQISRNLPTILLMHIPLSLPSLRNPGDPIGFGNPAWGWDRDKNYEIERRQRWPKSGNQPSTFTFYDTVCNTPNLIAVLCGHTHRNQVTPINDHAYQYQTLAGFQGGYRHITFCPLSE